MSKLPREAVKQYFPFYPSQWLTSRRLRVCSPAARGILIDLMAMAWEDGGKVCEDLDVLAVSMGLPSADLQTHLDELVKRERITITTKKGSPQVIHVPHLEAIYSESLAYIEARRADGKKGADARHKGEGRDPIGTLQAPSRDPIGTLSTDATVLDATVLDATESEQNPSKPKGTLKGTFKGTLKGQGGEWPGFDEFYEAYPIHKDRKAASAAWQRHKPPVDVVMAAIARFKAEDDDWRRGFAVHPTTFINGQRWNDEPKKAPHSATPQLTNAARGSDPHKYDHLIERSPNNG